MPKILALATAVPSHVVDQNALAVNLAKLLELDPKWTERLIKTFKNTRIEKRYTAIPDYQNEVLSGELYRRPFPQFIPGSHERNSIYKTAAPKLAAEAAKKALEQWGGDPQKITHVISVSCTGMMAPGIEFLLINQLGLSRSCAKYGINFMGCFGAFRGLAAARAFALENPSHRVLVVCTELCSLHMQASKNIHTFISNALFSDGAAAVVVGAEPISTEKPLWGINRLASYAVEDSLEEMTWEISDTGLVMGLTEKVPKLIKKKISEFCRTLVGDKIALSDCLWAPHPGGRAILNAIEEACNLGSEEDLKSSWHILKNFGNMSSATFLFVLEHMLIARSKKKLPDKEWSIGLGFGPGLTLEGILLKNV